MRNLMHFSMLETTCPPFCATIFPFEFRKNFAELRISALQQNFQVRIYCIKSKKIRR